MYEESLALTRLGCKARTRPIIEPVGVAPELELAVLRADGSREARHRGPQITHAWLMNRCFRIGRTITHLDPDAASLRLLGAPLKLWARVPRHALLYGLAALRGDRARFVAGLKLFRRRGQIYEYLSPDRRERWGSWLLPPRQPSAPHAPPTPLGGQTSPQRDAAAPRSE